MVGKIRARARWSDCSSVNERGSHCWCCRFKSPVQFWTSVSSVSTEAGSLLTMTKRVPSGVTANVLRGPRRDTRR
jgi:hypothetical protein